MALNTKYLKPAELTGFIRQAVFNDPSEGSLSRFLPDTKVYNVHCKFRIGENGLLPEAEARDWDAEPEGAGGQAYETRIFPLVPPSRRIPVLESETIIAASQGDAVARQLVLDTTNYAASSIRDAAERFRGRVLETGRATITQNNFGMNDDFGRDPELTFALPKLLSDDTSDLLSYLIDAADLYEDKNTGRRASTMLASTKVIRAFLEHKDFQVQIVNGVQRRTTLADVNAVLSDYDLPTIERYNRKTASGRVLSENKLFFLPDAGTKELGETVWGITKASFKAEFGIPAGEQPGPVAAVWDLDGTAGATIVDADSAFLPALKNANLSAAITVL